MDMQNWRWIHGTRRSAGWVLSMLLLLGVPLAQAQEELLVNSFASNQVLRYDGTTGAFLNAFVPHGSGGLFGPTELVFHARLGSTPAEEVLIDIKPGSSPNTINPKSQVVIAVAILSTETFDATTVNPESIRFGPQGAQEAHRHIEDVNHDGKPDLLLHFSTQATGIQCGHTAAALTGETFAGAPIRGSAAIQTVGCAK